MSHRIVLGVVVALLVAFSSVERGEVGASIESEDASALAARWAPWSSAPDLVQVSEPWPDRCERVWFDDTRGHVRRVRRRHTNNDRREMRGWLGQVAREFEPRDAANLARFLRLLASRESSYRPDAVHVLSEDREAAVRAAQKRSQEGGEWAGATVKVYLDSEGTVYLGDTRNAWRFSRGLYGMASALWLRDGGRWGEQLPPWALCDRRVSTVLLVWSARDAMRECSSLGFEPTYRTLNRRISSGHCRKRAEHFEREWTKRARDQGLDPDALVSFDGRSWPESSADRAALLRRLRSL